VNCLSSAAIAVERYENQLLVRGFGPSELRKNRRDLTVLHVNARNNETVIDAQVLYEGSAELDKRALDRAMRKKLERIFQKVAVEVEPRKEPWKQAKEGAGAKPGKKTGTATGGSSGKVAVAVPGRTVIVPPPPEVSATVPILSAAIVRESLVERVRQMASAHLRRKAAQPESVKLEVGAPLKFERTLEDAVHTAVEAQARVATAEALETIPTVLLDRSSEPKLDGEMASYGPGKRDRRRPQEVTPLSGDAALRLRETSFDGVKDRRGAGRPSERNKQELQLLPGKEMAPAGAGILTEEPVERSSFWLTWKNRIGPDQNGHSDRLLSPMALGIGLGIAAVLGTAIYVSHEGTGIATPRLATKVQRPAAPAVENAHAAEPNAARVAAESAPVAAAVSAPSASAPTSPSPVASANPAVSANPASGASPAASASLTPGADPAANKPAVRHGETALSVWLDVWANAMRGSNAATQASFYASSVDHYLNKGEVSNAVVLQERRKAIAARGTDWTSTLEDVRIHPTSPTTATVNFMRHDSQHLAPPKTNDLFMPEQLTLTLIDGEWKITSETENKAGAYSLVNN
jgi:hypothetical protein